MPESVSLENTNVLNAALLALKSYACGNSSSELAASIVERLENALHDSAARMDIYEKLPWLVVVNGRPILACVSKRRADILAEGGRRDTPEPTRSTIRVCHRDVYVVD